MMSFSLIVLAMTVCIQQLLPGYEPVDLVKDSLDTALDPNLVRPKDSPHSQSKNLILCQKNIPILTIVIMNMRRCQEVEKRVVTTLKRLQERAASPVSASTYNRRYSPT